MTSARASDARTRPDPYPCRPQRMPCLFQKEKACPTYPCMQMLPACNSARFVSTDARLMPADAYAGGDRYVCRDYICMRSLPTPINVAT